MDNSQYKKPLYALEELSALYGVLLFDTSALLTDFGAKNEDSKLRASIQSSGFYSEFITSGGEIYVTRSVLDEYEGNPILNQIKNRELDSQLCRQLRLHNISPENLELQNDEMSERQELIRLVKEKGMVIDPFNDNPEVYKHLSETYRYLRKQNDLSQIDFDLLISGATLSRSRMLTAIVSNDSRILVSWRKLIKLEEINPENLGFFVREDPNSFQMANPHKKI